MGPLSGNESVRRAVVDWAWAGRGLEDASGDLHVVIPFEHGALIALLDGLGHGPEAAAAAAAAVPVLEAFAHEHVLSLVKRCHDELRKTRGVVMSIASFDARDSTLTWAGVGNVEGVLIRATEVAGMRDEAILGRGGVVGYQLPPLRADTFLVSTGDTMILTTDGIRSGFSSSVVALDSPSEIADTILAEYAKGSDDAHVVVARYLGNSS